MATKKEEKVVEEETESNALVVSGIPKDVPVSFKPSQLALFLEKTPPDQIYEREGRGGKKFKYVKIQHVTKKLNYGFAYMWDSEVPWQISVTDALLTKNVVVLVKLTVKDNKGNSITKSQYGSSEVKYLKSGGLVDLGDDYKSAASDGLKKCASGLGIAADVYGGETEEKIIDITAKEVSEERGELGDGKWHISEQQRKFLYALCSKKKWTDKELHKNIKEQFGKEHLAELSREEFEHCLRAVGGDNIKDEDVPRDEKSTIKKDAFDGM